MLYSFIEFVYVILDLNRNIVIRKAVSCLCNYFLCCKIILPDPCSAVILTIPFAQVTLDNSSR